MTEWDNKGNKIPLSWNLDKGGQAKLATVKPALQKVIRRAVETSTQPFTIVQGNRTQAQQDALYAQGRTRRGLIVTWTRKSNHIGGSAIDFAPLHAGKVNWDEKKFPPEKYYPPIAAVIKQAAVELGIPVQWGFDLWKKDWGHVQLTKTGGRNA
jgi:peptidoglycan L-alanyl-D-glutamate endopeptidase CwlK